MFESHIAMVFFLLYCYYLEMRQTSIKLKVILQTKQAIDSLVVYSTPLLGSPAFIVGKRVADDEPDCFTAETDNSATDIVNIDSYYTIYVFTQGRQSTNGEARILAEKESKYDSQPFIMRAGTATMSIRECLAHTPKAVVDITGTPIGSCTLVKLEVSPKMVYWDLQADKEFQSAVHHEEEEEEVVVHQFGPSESPLRELVAASSEALRQAVKDVREYRTTVSGQTRKGMSFVAVRQHCGIIPVWAFPFLNINSDNRGADMYLEQSLANACYLLGMQKVKLSSNTPKAQVAEVLNQMQTLWSMAQLYVVDYSRQAPDAYICVDKWENMAITPNPALMSYDCEDGALRMLQESAWLLASESKQLDVVRSAERQMITFLCGMTLKLKQPQGKHTWTYHATALKLDRRWVLGKLGLEGGTTEMDVGERWPAVMMESTACTTGCLEFKSPLEGDREQVFKRSQTTFSCGETICKVTAKQMATASMYGVIQTLTCPELLTAHGIAQVELVQKGLHGAETASVMNYDRGVEWRPVRIMSKYDPEAITRLKTQAYAETPIPPLKAVQQPPPRQMSTRIDCCVRKVDWDVRGTPLELSKQRLGSPLQATELIIADNLSLMHVVDLCAKC